MAEGERAHPLLSLGENHGHVYLESFQTEERGFSHRLAEVPPDSVASFFQTLKYKK